MDERIFTGIEALPGAILPPEPGDSLAAIVTDEQGRTWYRTDLLLLDPENANEHNEDSVEAIAKSLCLYGQQKPVVVKAKGSTVIAGNGVLMAAQLLAPYFPRWSRVWTAVTELDDLGAMAYALDDNRTKQHSAFKWGTVGKQVKTLQDSGFDLSLTSFLACELEPLLKPSNMRAGDEPEPQPKPKKAREATSRKSAERGSSSSRILVELKGETADLFNWILERLREREDGSITQDQALHAIIAQYVADEQAIDARLAAQDAETEEGEGLHEG